MTPDAAVDNLVNALGLMGALALILALHRRGGPDAMRRRWTLALGLVAVMYGFRGLAWIGAGRGFEVATAVAAAGIPLAVLLVVEGLIRRHAPLAVKLVVLAGTIAVAVAIATSARFAGPVTLVLGVHVGLGLTLSAATAVAGMRGLDRAEARTVAALAACQIALIPAALSDFRELLPGTPARLSPLAVMLFGWVGLTVGAWRIPERLGWLALLAAIAALAGFGLAQAAAGVSWLQFAIVVLAAVMLVSICAEAVARPDAGLALRRALAGAPPGDREALLAALTASEVLGSGAVLSGADLDAAEPEAIRALAAEHPVLRLRDAPWDLVPDDIGAEAARALFEAHNATHLLAIGQAPLSLLAINLPALAANEAAETDLALVQRLIAATPGKTAP